MRAVGLPWHAPKHVARGALAAPRHLRRMGHEACSVYPGCGRSVSAPAVGVGVQKALMLEHWSKLLTDSLSSVVESMAAIVIAIAVARALVGYVQTIIRRRPGTTPPASIRFSLGRSLALALELLLAADILKTAVAPTWNDIGQLAAIAALRTGLNYFLERELRDAADSPSDPQPLA